ncbi:MAG: hypothetical protein AB7T49_17910 [Oligoflexales bacterium]
MVIRKWIALLALVSVAAACAKKEEDDAETQTSAGDVVLMNTINLGCGESSCFGEGSSSLKLLDGDTPALETLQMFAWISLGFPTEDDWANTLSGGEGSEPSDELKAMVPQEGFAGTIETMRGEFVEAALEAYPTLKSCKDAPTSGSFEFDDGTATWEEASMSAPGSFPEDKAGKTYDKAVTFESEDGTVTTHFEFFCDYNGMASVYTLKDDEGEQLAKYAFYYDRETSDDLYVDFYLLDDSHMINSDGNLELGVQLRSPEEGKMQVWVSRTGTLDTGTVQGYRYAVNADMGEDKYSFFKLHLDAEAGYTAAEWEALTNVDSTAVTGGTPLWNGGASEDRLINGCASGWDTPQSDLITADLCDGVDMEEAPVPGFDEDGSSSLLWIYENLRDNVNAL